MFLLSQPLSSHPLPTVALFLFLFLQWAKHIPTLRLLYCDPFTWSSLIQVFAGPASSFFLPASGHLAREMWDVHLPQQPSPVHATVFSSKALTAILVHGLLFSFVCGSSSQNTSLKTVWGCFVLLRSWNLGLCRWCVLDWSVSPQMRIFFHSSLPNYPAVTMCLYFCPGNILLCYFPFCPCSYVRCYQ